MHLQETADLAALDRLWPDAALRDAWRGLEQRLRGKSIREALALDTITDLGGLRRATGLAGMALHLERDSKGYLVNKRRPGVAYSTYPTAPWVGAVCARYVVKRAFRGRVARKDAPPLIADPTMESGELLLETAIAGWDELGSARKQGREFRTWLEQGLVGLDRRRDAAPLVRALFSVLSRVLDIDPAYPRLLVRDSLEWLDDEGVELDGLINNPPWGQRSDPNDAASLRRCTTSDHHLNPYIGFVELGIRRTRPGAPFAFVLPSQLLSARNAVRLRTMLLEDAELDAVALAPRRVFADAAVRSVIVLGRSAREGERTKRFVRVVYPAQHSLRVTSTARIGELNGDDLAHQPTWSIDFAEQDAGAHAPCAKLGDLGRVFSGLKAYKVGAGFPPQQRSTLARKPYTTDRLAKGHSPVIRGADVREFKVETASEFVAIGPWLAEPGPHLDVAQSKRVFVRELYRRDGKLTAAAAPPGVVGYHGVLTICTPAVSAVVLAALLNSEWAAGWVRSHSASYYKVCYHRLAVNELRMFPIPDAVVAPRTAQDRRVLHRLKALGGLRAPLSPAARCELNDIVARLYRTRASGVVQC